MKLIDDAEAHIRNIETKTLHAFIIYKTYNNLFI